MEPRSASKTGAWKNLTDTFERLREPAYPSKSNSKTPHVSDALSRVFFFSFYGEDERVRFSRCAFVLARKSDDKRRFGRGKVGRRIDSDCDDALCGVFAGGQVVV